MNRDYSQDLLKFLTILTYHSSHSKIGNRFIYLLMRYKGQK